MNIQVYSNLASLGGDVLYFSITSAALNAIIIVNFYGQIEQQILQ